jgi:hypothetical protein
MEKWKFLTLPGLELRLLINKLRIKERSDTFLKIVTFKSKSISTHIYIRQFCNNLLHRYTDILNISDRICKALNVGIISRPCFRRDEQGSSEVLPTHDCTDSAKLEKRSQVVQATDQHDRAVRWCDMKTYARSQFERECSVSWAMHAKCESNMAKFPDSRQLSYRLAQGKQLPASMARKSEFATAVA